MKNVLAFSFALVLLALPVAAKAALPPSDGPVITDANEMPAPDGGSSMVFDANEPDAQDADGATAANPAALEPKIQQPTITHVTSLQKCLDQLSPDEAAEVKLNAIYPYQECHSRLANRAEEKRHIRVAKQKRAEEDEEEVAESPRNFSRVAPGAGGDNDDQQAVAAAAMNATGDGNSGYWSSATAKPVKQKRVAREMPPQSAEELENLDDQYAPPQETHRKKKHSFFSWRPEISSSKSTASYNN